MFSKIGMLWVFMITTLVGCSGPADSVKDGVLDLDKSTTVGKALDSWVSCKSTKWDVVKNTNGSNLVTYTCSHKNVAEYSQQLNKNIDASRASLEDALSGDPTFSVKALKDKYPESLNLKEVDTVITFKLNQDETFLVDSIKHNLTWKDGSKFELLEENTELSMGMIYENKVAWTENTSYPGYILNLLKWKKNNAKMGNTNALVDASIALMMQNEYIQSKGLDYQSEVVSAITNKKTGEASNGELTEKNIEDMESSQGH